MSVNFRAVIAAPLARSGRKTKRRTRSPTLDTTSVASQGKQFSGASRTTAQLPRSDTGVLSPDVSGSALNGMPLSHPAVLSSLALSVAALATFAAAQSCDEFNAGVATGTTDVGGLGAEATLSGDAESQAFSTKLTSPSSGSFGGLFFTAATAFQGPGGFSAKFSIQNTGAPNRGTRGNTSSQARQTGHLPPLRSAPVRQVTVLPGGAGPTP
jgi:hypothetical protein